MAESAYTGLGRSFWTICTYEKRTVFTDRPTVGCVLERVTASGTIEGIDVVAYCFMPDHVHMVVAGRSADSSARRFIARVKQSSGYWFRQHTGLRLWQKSSWDRLLQTNQEVEAAIRYTLENPVRAGLVTQPSEYPFSGCLFGPCVAAGLQPGVR